MHQQQQPNDKLTQKQTFNILYLILLAFQRGVTVPFRTRYGSEALGRPGFTACILIVLWAVFSQNQLMYLWLLFWLFALAVRRLETFRLLRRGVRLHSGYDGWPKFAMRFCKSETAARLFMEP